MYKLGVIVPVYNHPDYIGALVEYVQSLSLPVVLINDGSDTACTVLLRDISASTGVALVEHASNQGKGAAVTSGLQYAAAQGWSHALQLDADGQHHWPDIGKFVEASRQQPQAVVIGKPQFDSSVPKKRLYGRYVTHVWVWINTLSLDIKDSMCGFRIYPVAATLAITDSVHLQPRMGFDCEILVRLKWQGLPFINIDTPVIYPEGGTSHFNAWRDNWSLSKAHARLFMGMLLRLPVLLYRKWRA